MDLIDEVTIAGHTAGVTDWSDDSCTVFQDGEAVVVIYDHFAHLGMHYRDEPIHAAACIVIANVLRERAAEIARRVNG